MAASRPCSASSFSARRSTCKKNICRPNKKIINGIQTNGTTIDEEWCEFLAKENFYIGLSLDGPRELHDHYRVTKGQKPTHKQVVQAFHMLRKAKVHVDLLCVVHDVNVKHPTQVYRYFKEIGGQYLQFLPLVEKTGDPNNPVHKRSVPSAAYGKFLNTIFDEWVRHDIGKVFIQLFDESVRPFLGMEHALCIYRETCGDVPVVEHNGDFYSCDHYVLPEYKIGNIHERPLAEMVEDEKQREFGQKKWTSLPKYCRECEVLSMCNGGCPKDRIIKTPDGEAGLNYLCAGLKGFFTHSKPYFQKFAELVEAGEPIEKLMEIVRAAEAKASVRQAGRNDPCPCGSGKKYKRCCGGARPAA